MREKQKGEIGLSYLLKISGATCLTLAINTAFDGVSNMLETYRVQLLATSGPVVTAQRCVYETMLSGSYSQLPRCSSSPALDSNEPAVRVDYEGVVRVEKRVQNTPVTLEFTPRFNSRGAIDWRCRGEPMTYMPGTCGGSLF